MRLLQIGSVLGREFDFGTVARMLGRQVGSLLSGVEAALNAGLLAAEGPRLAFRHDLLRQAVRETYRQPYGPLCTGRPPRVCAPPGHDRRRWPGMSSWRAARSTTTPWPRCTPPYGNCPRRHPTRPPTSLSGSPACCPRDRRRVSLLTDAAGPRRPAGFSEALDLVDAALSTAWSRYRRQTCAWWLPEYRPGRGRRRRRRAAPPAGLWTSPRCRQTYVPCC